MLSLINQLEYGEEIFYSPYNLDLSSSIWHYGRTDIRSHDYSLYGHDRGTNPYAIFQYTISGRGALVHEGDYYDVLPGTAMILTVPQAHHYYLPKDSNGWDCLYLGLGGAELIKVFNAITKRSGPLISIPENSRIFELVASIFSLKRTDPNLTDFMLSAKAYELAMAVQELVWETVKSEYTKPQFVEKVINYCNANIGAQISVNDMAKIAGYSKYHFTRLFTESEGKSPASFLKNLKLDVAAHLLCSQHCSVKETAFRTGFDDPSYFCRVFKEKFGVSPAKFQGL